MDANLDRLCTSEDLSQTLTTVKQLLGSKTGLERESESHHQGELVVEGAECVQGGEGTQGPEKEPGKSSIIHRDHRGRELPEESGGRREVRETEAQEQAPGPSRYSGWESVKGRSGDSWWRWEQRVW